MQESEKWTFGVICITLNVITQGNREYWRLNRKYEKAMEWVNELLQEAILAQQPPPAAGDAMNPSTAGGPAPGLLAIMPAPREEVTAEASDAGNQSSDVPTTRSPVKWNKSLHVRRSPQGSYIAKTLRKTVKQAREQAKRMKSENRSLCVSREAQKQTLGWDKAQLKQQKERAEQAAVTTKTEKEQQEQVNRKLTTEIASVKQEVESLKQRLASTGAEKKALEGDREQLKQEKERAEQAVTTTKAEKERQEQVNRDRTTTIGIVSQFLQDSQQALANQRFLYRVCDAANIRLRDLAFIRDEDHKLEMRYKLADIQTLRDELNSAELENTRLTRDYRQQFEEQNAIISELREKLLVLDGLLLPSRAHFDARVEAIDDCLRVKRALQRILHPDSHADCAALR